MQGSGIQTARGSLSYPKDAASGTREGRTYIPIPERLVPSEREDEEAREA